MTIEVREAAIPLGRELIDATRSWKHPGAKSCPTCGDSVMTVAIVNLAYTFEPCDCPSADYVHLREQLWHRVCLIAPTCSGFNPHKQRGGGYGPTCRDCGRTEASHAKDSKP